MKKISVAKWDELADRTPAYALVADVDLVIVRYDDRVSVLYGRCAHRGALMADGYIDGDNIICGVHGWDYRYDTGVSEYNNSETLPKFRAWVEAHPGHVVISYINCSAAVKSLSDIICTSSNAVKVVNSVPEGTPILFAPDEHLGNYLVRTTGGVLVSFGTFVSLFAGIGWGVLIFRESHDVSIWLAVAVLVLALMLVTWEIRRSHPSQQVLNR